jgi:xanthine/uracil permease
LTNNGGQTDDRDGAGRRRGRAIRILASDGIVVGTVTAVVLNLVLPRKDLGPRSDGIEPNC